MKEFTVKLPVSTVKRMILKKFIGFNSGSISYVILSMFMLAVLTISVQGQEVCPNTTERNVNNWYYFNQVSPGTYQPKGLFYPLNWQSACRNTLGDGARYHAFKSFDLLPSIRFSYDETDISYTEFGTNMGECTLERAARVGLMTPFTGAGNMVTTGMYPISLDGQNWGAVDTSVGGCPGPESPKNFQAGDAFLVSTCGAKNLLLSTNNPDARIKLFTTPTLGTQYERMTILNNGNVGIGTYNPIGKLDINVGTLNYNLPKISFTSGATTADPVPGPQMRFYSPSGNPNCEEGRSTSYSWYIQSLRQYNPACFTKLDGTTDATGINTTLGALHFRAGYNATASTLTPAVGDMYSSIIGTESSIARMSLLSNGNVGINREIPMVRFNVYNGAVLFDGTQGNTPVKRGFNTTSGEFEQQEIGDGTRLMWIPSKAAFRAGEVQLSTSGDDPEVFVLNDFPTISIPTASYWNSGSIGNHSFAFGQNVRSSGIYDIAMGSNNVSDSRNSPNPAAQHCAMTFGHNNVCLGTDNAAIGFYNRVIGGIAIGNHNVVNGGYVDVDPLTTYTNAYNGGFVIGAYNEIGTTTTLPLGDHPWTYSPAKGGIIMGGFCNLTSATSGSILIGSGISAASKLTFTASDALAVGFQSTVPTFYVGPGDGTAGSYGNVGIGTITPVNRFDVNGSVSVGYGATPGTFFGTTIPNNSLFVKTSVGIGTTAPKNGLDVTTSATIGYGTLSTLGSGVSLAVNNNVGIGTNAPACKLGVNGTACIGWGGDNLVPTSGGDPVSMIVEDAVIIGGNTSGLPAHLVATGRHSNPSLLHVWGDAVKMAPDQDWDIPSDARYKKNIKSFTDGLELLKQINPITFRYTEQLGIKQDEDGIGVLAQDMQRIAPYTVRENTLINSIKAKVEKRYQVDDQDTVIIKVIDYANIDYIPTDSTPIIHHYNYKDSTIYVPTKKWIIEPAEFRNDSLPLLTYNPSALTYVIINSIKEMDSIRVNDKLHIEQKINSLQEQNTSLHNQNDSLKIIVNNLQDRVARLETEKQIPLDGEQDIILEQNNPNPFSENSTIIYYIPEKVLGDAELVITPITQSPALQKFSLTKGTPTQLIISAKDLYTGVFVYSITVNGKVIVSKKFIIIK